MAQQARIVLNCVGPYRFYGEAVVEACVEAGAHHLDISGEPQYLEKMQLKYHQVSQRRKRQKDQDQFRKLWRTEYMSLVLVVSTRSPQISARSASRRRWGAR